MTVLPLCSYSPLPLLRTDAGTDCALGEVFTAELPADVATVQIEVIAKHSLTGDELIGTASLECDLIRDSGGDVLRVPVMSKKGSMHGELECTGSITESGPSAPQVRSGLNIFVCSCTLSVAWRT